MKSLTKAQITSTEPWIRNQNDEWAIDEGCWWDLERAAYHVYWVESNCALYEGVYAGEPLVLHSIADQPAFDVPEEFYGDDGRVIPEVLEFYADRFRWHNEMQESGEFMHFHFECAARFYGWQRPSKRWVKRGIHHVRRHTTGAIWCAKKNSKSPILAKDILYITCADGEDGMKSFICAKDGKQAMIPWQHAYFMIKQSDNLRDPSICTPNMTTKRVVYQPSNSWFEPLSSANSRVQDAKEGLNGSVFIDETHTVDREFMSIVEFAGASRVQPVHMMYSTAGKNPDSYGKEMWDYGESVVSGQVKDTRYFHQSYHAPQNLTVEQFEKNPEMYIRMANPSLGLTVDLDEILSGWERAKRKGKFDIVKFFLYRLNVWSNAADVWLAPGVWDACGGHIFEDDDVVELPCVIGLDLARKFDMAAAVFAWANDLGGVDLRPMFWCNEERVQQMATHCPKMLDWKDAGFVRVNEGNVTDFAEVEKDLREEIERLNVVGMVYDATYAEGLIQRLQGGVTGPDGTMVYEPLGFAEQAMSQGAKTQTGPTTDFENQLKKKEIRHESHPVLDWQFSHANVKENGPGDIMVQKENRKSFKTVDGCQAAIMARWGLLDFEGFQTAVLDFYEENEDGIEF